MTPSQICALIGKYIMGNYNPIDDEQEWLKIRQQLLNIKEWQPQEYRDAVLSVLESTMHLLQLKEFAK